MNTEDIDTWNNKKQHSWNDIKQSLERLNTDPTSVGEFSSILDDVVGNKEMPVHHWGMILYSW